MKPSSKYELWLQAGYEYYIAPPEFDLPIMSDFDYDRLSEELLNTFNEWDHPLKYLVCEDDLRCGSGFAIKWADWLAYANKEGIYSQTLDKPVNEEG